MNFKNNRLSKFEFQESEERKESKIFERELEIEEFFIDGQKLKKFVIN